MRENSTSSGTCGNTIINMSADNQHHHSESNFKRTSSRRIPLRSNTPVRNGHSKSNQSSDNSRNFSPRSASLISRRKKVQEPLPSSIETEKKIAPSQDENICVDTQTYDLMTTDILQIKRSLLCLGKILSTQNDEKHETNGYNSDEYHEDEETVRDIKQRVLILQRETEEKSKIIENLRNEINKMKFQQHQKQNKTFISKCTQTDQNYLDLYNNNNNVEDSKMLLVRTSSDSTSQKTCKLSKVPILPWRREGHSSRKK